MTRFDEFCNLILEVYGKKIEVPQDGRTAPDRFNNPGGAYPKQGFERFGMEGYDVIGGGHPIAKYPTLANGIAANIAHLKSMPIVGKTVGQARYYWVNGNFGGSEGIPGMNSGEVITQEKLNDPNWLEQWMRGTAQLEGFTRDGRSIDNASFAQAMNILKNNSDFLPSSEYNPSQQYASNTSSTGVTNTASNFKQDTQSTAKEGEKPEEKEEPLTPELAKDKYIKAANIAKGILTKFGSKLA